MTFVNADFGGQRSSLRLQGGRITHLHTPPMRGDLVLDLGGDRLLPGLINAHDHLQLNHFPALQYPALYGNAAEWIEDFNARLRDNPAVRASAAVPRAQRLLGGGLKNLLSGVTTVAHHDPLDALLQRASFPTRVVREFGWSHSLHVDGEARVRASCAGTPAGQPWIIHAAEGVDAQAHAEFERLAALGRLRPHTLLVHALGLDESQRSSWRPQVAGSSGAPPRTCGCSAAPRRWAISSRPAAWRSAATRASPPPATCCRSSAPPGRRCRWMRRRSSGW